MYFIRQYFSLFQGSGKFYPPAFSPAAGMDLSLDEALRLESDTFVNLFDTDDRREGMTAFLEKRKPNWVREQ